MKQVQWGILSTAGIAQKELIPAFQRATNADVAAIATGSDLDKATSVAEAFDIEKVYGSYEALLADTEIDAVYIPLPNHLHKQWVIEAARKGKHILCEKPAALNAEETLEMKQVCEEAGVLFMEGFMYHFHPQHQRVKEMIESGEIGDVKYMQAGFSFYLDDERRKNSIKMTRETGGGSIYDVGCYAIHAIRNILGSEPDSVHAHAFNEPNMEVETDVVTYMTFPNAVRASFDVSFNYARRAEYIVYGTKGRIIVPRAFRPDWFGGDGQVIVENENKNRTETMYGDQYKNEVEHISEAILNGKSLKELDHDFENTVNNMRVIDACLKSIEIDGTVEVEK